MLKLTNRKWKDFSLGSLFEITGSKTTKVDTLEAIGDGLYPYVTTQTTNNGQAGYYNHFTEKGNILVIDSAVVGFCTFQKNNFTASDHVEKLIPKFPIDKHIALFLTNVINANNSKKFSYGYKASQTRLKDTKIFLPISNDGLPDFDFMREYIKEREQQKLQQYISFAKNELKKIGSDIDVKEEKLKWKDFFVEDIFDIISGKDAPLSENEGDIPYINSSGVNNGITCFVKDCSVKVKNCITIARTGTVGSTFYQQNEVGISGNIRALYLKDRELNKEIAQFLITALKNSIEGNFDYGKILGTERIKHLKIKLPVDADGNIDYKYMEAYIYIYISMQLKRYLGYLKNVV